MRVELLTQAIELPEFEDPVLNIEKTETQIAEEIGYITTLLIESVGDIKPFSEVQGTSRWADESTIEADGIIIRAVKARGPYNSSVTVSESTPDGEKVIHRSEVEYSFIGGDEGWLRLFDSVKTSTVSQVADGSTVKRNTEVKPNFVEDGPVKLIATTFTLFQDGPATYDYRDGERDTESLSEVRQTAWQNSIEAVRQIRAAIARVEETRTLQTIDQVEPQVTDPLPLNHHKVAA